MSPPTSAPRLLRLLATLLLPGADREFVVGDLEEAFARRAARDGRTRASLRYLRDLIASAAIRRVTTHHPLRGLAGDVRMALRMARRERRFTALAVLTLALGIGTAASVFGMADRLLLRPLPGVHDDGRGAYLRIHAAEDATGALQHNLTTPEFDALRAGATLLEGMASYGFAPFNASAGEVARPALATLIYGDYFDVLGVRPLAGRLLTGAETGVDADPLRVVVSERIATEFFGTAAAAVGRTLRLNDRPVTVVGVTGEGFRGAQRDVFVDLWLPWPAVGPLMGVPDEKIRDRAGQPHGLFVLRTRPDAKVDGVRAQLEGILGRLADEEARYDQEGRLAGAEPRITRGLGIPPDRRPQLMSALRMVGGAVALVVLIACANVANLLLFRNVARQGPLTTRRALGASSGRIAREQLVQSLFLGGLGAVAGLGVGWLFSVLLDDQALGGFPASEPLALDGRVALFAAAASLVTALLFGTFPALLAGRFDLAAALRRAGHHHTGRLGVVRAGLAAGQLALTLTLGIGALLLVRTVHNLSTANTGLDDHGVAYTLQAHTAGLDRAGQEALAHRVLAALEAVPGVDRAAVGPPDMDATGGRSAARFGLPGSPEEERVEAALVPVTPGWFEVFHVEAEAGRLLREDDAMTDVVLTASLASKLFGADDAVGHSLGGVFGGGDLRVVGVVPALAGSGAPDRPRDAVFAPYAAAPVTALFPLVVRTRTLDAEVTRRLARAIEGVLPSEPVRAPRPVRSDRRHAEERSLGRLLLVLAALAAVLGSVGLYGIIAFVVAGRRHEFGIRLALGAAPAGVARLVFRYGAGILGAGTLAGLFGAWALAGVLRSRLFGVGPLDPLAYLGGAALLAGVATVACWLPARRATRVDPVAALRRD